MPIHYLEAHRSFFLQSAGSSYICQILPQGYLAHVYWGAPLQPQNLDFAFQWRDRPFSPNPDNSNRAFSLDTARLEYPVYGNSDYRSPAISVVRSSDGSRQIDLRYKSHTIVPGKPALAGLPATLASDSQADTLTITLADEELGIEVDLLYTVFAEVPVITRSALVRNVGPATIDLERVLSASVDFIPSVAGSHFVHLSGAWSRERSVEVSPLRLGTQSVESRRGTSSHQHNPFFALAQHGADEECGNVYGFNLVYSGNFVASVETDAHDSVRGQIGINPFDFGWKLEAGETFQSPEAVLVFSPEGLGGLSRAYHRFYREHLIRGKWKHEPRPVLVNNWEATYFDFDAEKLEKIAATGAELGVELFVLDDGWFGKRNDDTTSLGDWKIDPRKLPGGLEDLARRINEKGVAFGLWFEPEMISPDSDLYRAHPDWCLHVGDRPLSQGRNQLVLDFSRADVVENIYDQMAQILRTVPISYVKWDMNRHLTEIGSAKLPADRQKETAHRYVLGLYALLERLTSEFPEVLFEGCSGGGGRFDPGILAYMPQYWTSDNSDAIARLSIQYGTSIVYPMSTMGAHVSVVPNHQLGRVTPFRTRGEVAFTGAFGYELDLGALSPEDREETARQIALYKEVRPLLMQGDLYRLRSPFRSNEFAWMVVSADRREAVVTHVNVLAQANPTQLFLPLRGLDAALEYKVQGADVTYRGDALMQLGLPVPPAFGDFISTQWWLKA